MIRFTRQFLGALVTRLGLTNTDQSVTKLKNDFVTPIIDLERGVFDMFVRSAEYVAPNANEFQTIAQLSPGSGLIEIGKYEWIQLVNIYMYNDNADAVPTVETTFQINVTQPTTGALGNLRFIHNRWLIGATAAGTTKSFTAARVAPTEPEASKKIFIQAPQGGNVIAAMPILVELQINSNVGGAALGAQTVGYRSYWIAKRKFDLIV